MEELGSEFVNYQVSCGTCKTEDIVENICTFVSNHEIGDPALSELLDEFHEEERYMEQEQLDSPSCLEEIYDDIYSRMQELAPEGCYFGASVGDGTAIGFWECE